MEGNINNQVGGAKIFLFDLSVSIVSHNSRKDLELLMPSLKISLQNFNYEILLVDNNSDDDSVRFVKDNYPEVNITENVDRRGYGTNHNKNLKKARGKYIVFMNADIVLMPETFEILYEFMDKNDDVGISCANVLNPDGTPQYLYKQYPSIIDLFLRRFVFLFPSTVVNKRLNYYEMRGKAYESSVDVPFISGCFMFCRIDEIRVVEGFDETFFLYFEDVDLCRKVQKNNRTVSCPEAKVIHRWERVSHKELKWFFIFVKSAIQYFNKWGYLLY